MRLGLWAATAAVAIFLAPGAAGAQVKSVSIRLDLEG
jgi:hypothetical protein